MSISMQSEFHILLVEDYKANIMVATLLLESFGYSCSVAETGEDALRKIEEQHFDLILMDVQMPLMNGFEATQRIREREAEKHLARVPVIGMTAHALSGDREKCIEAGMDDYLSKPFQPEQLQALLDKYTAKRAAA